MAEIDANHFEAAQRALCWLLYAARPLTVTELAEAAILSHLKPCLNPDERFDEAECILAILPSSFIRVSSDENVFVSRISGE